MAATPSPSRSSRARACRSFSRRTRPRPPQTPGLPTPVASFNVTELRLPARTDKVGKDDNFRGMTLYNNVLYVTKGSGSNGVNTVYFVDTTGTACPPRHSRRRTAGPRRAPAHRQPRRDL